MFVAELLGTTLPPPTPVTRALTGAQGSEEAEEVWSMPDEESQVRPLRFRHLPRGACTTLARGLDCSEHGGLSAPAGPALTATWSASASHGVSVVVVLLLVHDMS